MVEDLKIFQSGRQVFLKQVLNGKSGVQFPPIPFRTRLYCVTLAGFE